MTRPRSWFLPDAEPILSVLTSQWAAVEESLHAVWSWTQEASTLAEAEEALRASGHREHDLRRKLHRGVRAAFWTPLDAEDIYELGERIGMVQRQLHLLLREADASSSAPDSGLAGILSAVVAASAPLGRAITMLPSDDAANAADEAADQLEAADHAYKVALAGLPQDDIHREICLRELYQRGEHVTEAAARVAHRAWYAVCKIA